MKRVIAILLIVFYLVPAIGITVNKHYCGGKLASVKIVFGDTHSCPCGSKPMKKDCCKDKTGFLQQKNDAGKTFQFVFKTAPQKISPFAVAQVVTLPSAQFIITAADYYHPLPYKPKAPIYLLDRVLLI